MITLSLSNKPQDRVEMFQPAMQHPGTCPPTVNWTNVIRPFTTVSREEGPEENHLGYTKK